jgi:uncharacterized protein with PIN domain
MKFIADVMLGKLAKRLRLLGFDVLYDRSLNDHEIIHLSLEEHRVILSRDTGLVERPLASNHCFIKSDHVRDQLKQVLDVFSLSPYASPLTRCSKCNEPLVPIMKQDVRDIIPQFVYENNEEFLHCSQCGRTYWKGTHRRHENSISDPEAVVNRGQQD